MYEDKTLECKECGQDFVFTVGEQEFYAEKGFQNEPARCPQCRSARKQKMNRRNPEREMHEVVCSTCGINTQVPFKPSQDRPVYCKDCFTSQNQY